MQFTRDADRAFDLWLARSLAGQYASALHEELPHALLALLETPPSRADAEGCAGSC